MQERAGLGAVGLRRCTGKRKIDRIYSVLGTLEVLKERNRKNFYHTQKPHKQNMPYIHIYACISYVHSQW